MKRIRTARELYCELLKGFYFGVYHKNDKLMTYQKTHEIYGLAKDTIGAAYDMLRRDGFIRTDGANGTIVTFDVNNPAHVAKVPLEWPRAVPEDTIPYEVAMRLHAHSLYTGLTHSSESQLQACKEIVGDILQRVKSECAYNDQVFAFWTCVISTLDNNFLSHITDHFISRYLYLLPPTHLSPTQQHLISSSAREYYEFLLDAMDRRSFEEFPARFERHYHNYYQYGGVVFSKLEDGAVFKEQARYGRLLDEFCIKILSGELHKGDALPTTKHVCVHYGLSATTVNRTYGILAEMGFISRRVRSGTTLIAELNDPETWKTLEKRSGLHLRDCKDAAEVLVIIIGALSSRISIERNVIQQMRAELARQYALFKRYVMPFFVSPVLLSPLIASLPAGILDKYYVQLMDVLNKAITLCTFRVCGSKTHGEEVYQLMCDALEALERGDQPSFAALSERAILRNVTLLAEDYLRATREIGCKRETSGKREPRPETRVKKTAN